MLSTRRLGSPRPFRRAVPHTCPPRAAASPPVLPPPGLPTTQPPAPPWIALPRPALRRTALPRPDRVATLVGAVVGRARASGFRRLTVEADPNAEGFYRALGAVLVGSAASGSIPGRRLPLLRLDLDER